tara:strand:- start:609 stop:1103 length:495 start_codon:yes stop_codon:yes gene_type:complete
MFKLNFKKTLLNLFIILSIFSFDRLSKIYVLKIAELNDGIDIYVTSYLNLFLVWNKGVAFGLLSAEGDLMYNIVTVMILTITLIVLLLITKSKGLEKLAFISVFGGATGNIFDRIYYSAVPDFIDVHIGDFHWFIFNIADIFITMGVICLIYVEIFTDKIKNEK